MDTNHPNEPEEIVEADPEYDRIRSLTPGLEESPVEEPSEEEPKEETVVEEPTAEPEEEPTTTEEAPAEPTEPVEPDEEPQAQARPEKYIPVAKYTSEKQAWKEKEADLLSQLEKANASQGKAREDAIRTFAEENGVPEESLKELLSTIEPGDEATSTELDGTVQAALAEGALLKAEKAYDAEFNTVATPYLKNLYPDATQEQLSAAKAELEKLACTSTFLDKSLDYVAFMSQKDLAPLFETKTTRKGPEGTTRAPVRGNEDYKAEDFKDGKTSFDVISTLPASKQAEIVEKMDMQTYEKYSRWEDSNSRSTLNRGGTKVEY